MIKRPGARHGKVAVTFEVDPAVGAHRAFVCGEFNDWSQESHAMNRNGEGGFNLTVELPAGRAYRFRYFLDGERWENDWAADDYVPNEFGSHDSVIDLSHVSGEEPPPVKRAEPATNAAKKDAPKKAAAKKAGAKKAGAKKAAAKKASPPPSDDPDSPPR
jgi:1,4-alpha-glucan branching enzyme